MHSIFSVLILSCLSQVHHLELKKLTLTSLTYVFHLKLKNASINLPSHAQNKLKFTVQSTKQYHYLILVTTHLISHLTTLKNVKIVLISTSVIWVHRNIPYLVSTPKHLKLTQGFSSLKMHWNLVGTYDGGWLNDIIFQQVIDLLNFSGEYYSASKRGGFNVPSIVFGDAYADSHKINPKEKGWIRPYQ